MNIPKKFVGFYKLKKWNKDLLLVGLVVIDTVYSKEDYGSIFATVIKKRLSGHVMLELTFEPD
jgi:hypothetical protein